MAIHTSSDIIAQRYVISSSVSHYTSSAASGSHIFGDTLDDTHQFTGSIYVTGSVISIHGGSNSRLDLDGASDNAGEISFKQAGTANAYIQWTADTYLNYKAISGHNRFQESVAIGNVTPDTNLHVWKASAGSVSAASDAQLVVENSGVTAINLLSGNSSHGQILFGDDGDNDRSQLGYDHAEDTFYVKVNGSGTKVFKLDSSG